MEWTRVASVMAIIGCILLCKNPGLANLTDDVTLTFNADMPSTPCHQDLFKKIALCIDRKLTKVPTTLHDDILILHLRNNSITTLRNTSFSRYASLLELNLEDNDIRSINTAAFYPMKNLRLLTLAGNVNLQLPGGEIFYMSAHLSKLDLSRCSLLNFPSDILRWLPQLREINLTSNDIGRNTSIGITYCPNDKMTVLLANNDIYSLTEETFRIPCGIEELDLSHTNLQHVDPRVFLTLSISRLVITTSHHNFSTDVYKDLFTGIAWSSIKSLICIFSWGEKFSFPWEVFDKLGDIALLNLTLQGNIIRLHPYALRNLTSLNQLTIKETGIKSIHPKYFDSMLGLHVLNLAHNKISQFNRRCSSWNLRINHLNLSHNNINYMADDMFAGLQDLRSLDLSDNPHLMFVWRHSLSSLRYLDVSRTSLPLIYATYPKLQTILISGMVCKGVTLYALNMPFLQQMIADNSCLTEHELWRNTSHGKSVFSGLHDLATLDLNHNDLRNLGLFPYLPNLTELNLGNNKISTIKSGALMGLETLTRLYLDHNRISSLTHAIFNKRMIHLKVMYLNWNLLTYLGKYFFVTTPNLRQLDISNNELTILDMNTFIPIQSTLKVMDMSENPIVCSCEIIWLIDWQNAADTHVAQANKTQCAQDSDEPFRGRSVFMFDPTDYCASNIIDTNLYFMITLIAVLLSIMLAIYFKKWLARYKLFRLKLAIRGYEEIQDNRNPGDYEFDLNVFFTDEVEDWARQYLQPKIKEYLPHFDRVVLGDDDLPLGMYYVEAVLHVIERSFKIILLLSRAACRDNKFMMKLRATLNHLTNTRSQCTLLIFLENIPDEELPHLVRLYLSEERPYLFWFEDEKDNNYFWIKFAKILRANVQRNDLIPPE